MKRFMPFRLFSDRQRLLWSQDGDGQEESPCDFLGFLVSLSCELVQGRDWQCLERISEPSSELRRHRQSQGLVTLQPADPPL
jgi:hypothetical protein